MEKGRNYTPPKDGDCVLPKAPCWEPMISAVCSNHPGEATLPLRWLCQLPLCRLAAEKRLQAIIPRQQVYTVDWNEQYHAEEWRHGWEVVQNKYLELAGSPERIDMRSYERQGLDIIPTVHMGTAVSALERKGIATNIGNLNRDIKAANRMMNAIRSTIKNLRDWIADILEATKEVLAENEAAKKNASPNLAVLLRDYLNLRKAERSEWSRYGQQKESYKAYR